MKAGAKWKQGADTCVFKPAVKCEGESGVRPGISRIVSGETAANEERVEEVLKARFPELIKNGSITVSSHVCSPEFTPEDEKLGEEIQVAFNQKKQGFINTRLGCESIDKSSSRNFITPEVDGVPYFQWASSDRSVSDKYKAIRNVIDAAVQLVPDNGPWVIHTDLHDGNILVKKALFNIEITGIDNYNYQYNFVTKDPNNFFADGENIFNLSLKFGLSIIF
jgi:hypothetical protein